MPPALSVSKSTKPKRSQRKRLFVQGLRSQRLPETSQRRQVAHQWVKKYSSNTQLSRLVINKQNKSSLASFQAGSLVASFKNLFHPLPLQTLPTHPEASDGIPQLESKFPGAQRSDWGYMGYTDQVEARSMGNHPKAAKTHASNRYKNV